MIEFNDVSKIFPNGTVALENVNLKIEDGELVGYTAESSFYKAFQSYYHMTPQEYRSAKVPVVTDK